MRAEEVIALIYAHATKDERMWDRSVDAIFASMKRKGLDSVAQDIKDAYMGYRCVESKIGQTKDDTSYVHEVWLKKCPCCGHESEILHGDAINSRVKCSFCGLMTEVDYEEGAIATWNRRVNE